MPKEGEEGAQTQAQAQDQAQSHVQEQTLLSASAPPRVVVLLATDNGLKLPAAGDADAATAGVLSTPTTPVPSLENYVAADQNDKKARGPVPVPINASASQRPNGHSLLTQQLAEARGIAPPVTGQAPDAPHPSVRLQHPPCDTLIGSLPNQDPVCQGGDTAAQDTTDSPEAYHENDEDLLTPRASPRSIAMATNSAVSTMSLQTRATDTTLPYIFDTLDSSEDVQVRTKSQGNTLRSLGISTSMESTDREHRFKEPSFTTRTFSETNVPPGVATTSTANQAPTQTNGRLIPGSVAEPLSPTRPRKPEHRVSTTGPEKVWSIGSEDFSNAQDGQVEKSIAEVLAGVEPNARSRKASHSLRFFKEGLPEEKLKRRDSRLGPKDKLSATDDVLQNGGLRVEDPTRSLQPSPGPSGELPGLLTRTKTFPPASTSSQHSDAGLADYFETRPEHKGYDDLKSPFEPDAETLQPLEDYTTLNTDTEEQETASDTAVEDVAGEDGELSGEEKISSAVFVPHKGLQDVPEHSDEAESDQDAHVKPYQKSEDGSSWLVKADEPEADDPGSPDSAGSDKADEAVHHRREAELSVIGSEPPTRAIPIPPTSNELDPAPKKASKSADLASPGHEEHVHDHRVAPEQQPLDAIELVPYRHQVGGHTTVWRFSKKAVCKQLNNRENEFYEQIERYHRDLLPFLPRYAPELCAKISRFLSY